MWDPGSRVGAAWIDILTLIVCLVLFELVASTILFVVLDMTLGPFDIGADADDSGVARLMLIPGLALRAIGAFVIIALILRHRGQSARSVGLHGQRPVVNGLLGVATAIVAYWAVALTMVMFLLAWPGVVEQMQENARLISNMVPHLHPLGFVVLSAMIGLYEELLFRGFLMTRLHRATGSWILAVLISTIVFTALHALDQVSMALVAVTILSILFSLVTIWRRSIVPAIIGHGLWNLVQFLQLHVTAGDSWV